MTTIAVIVLFFYMLYRLGCLPVSIKRAAVYVGSGSWRNRCIGASFTACSGRIQRVVRFPEGRSYSFRLSGHVQQGGVRVRLLDGHRVPVLELTPASPSGIVRIPPKKPYYLQILFENASGDYQLQWD